MTAWGCFEPGFEKYGSLGANLEGREHSSLLLRTYVLYGWYKANGPSAAFIRSRKVSEERDK